MSTDRIAELEAENEELRQKNEQLKNMLFELFKSPIYYPSIDDIHTYDQCSDHNQVEYLRLKGRDINEYRTKDPDNHNLKPIHSVCDNIQKLTLLIANDVDINGKTYNEGKTALHLCVENGRLDACHILIAAGADTNAKDYNNSTPLFAALDNPEMLLLLLSSGANVNVFNNDNMTPLFLAVVKNNVGACIQLIRKGADINICNHKGITPLIYSIYENQSELVKVLIENGADVNMKSIQGLTPLMCAVIMNNLNTVQLLIDYGADINTVSNKGLTAIDYCKDDTIMETLRAKC